jgi:hypothetical protein
MLLTSFIGLTTLIFLAMTGGIAGIAIESQRTPSLAALRNPAMRDALLAIVGWAALFVLYFAIAFVGVSNMTLEFRQQLGALVTLPLYHAIIATLRLIYLSARRVHAWWRADSAPVRPHAIPFLQKLAAPILFVSAILSAATEWARAGASIYFFLLASIAVLLAFIRKREPAQ